MPDIIFRMNKFLIVPLLLFIVSCNPSEERTEAEQIIDRVIEKAGGEKYAKANIEFDFRDTRYTSKRDQGQYEFTRNITDSTGTTYYDVLNNHSFTRYRQDEKVEISDSLAGVYAESVNAVHYFVQLPYGLNDAAVLKELVGEDTINNEPYYEIRVTFKQEGGGADHEDEYLYWVNKDELTIDYLAYRFFVNDGGIRFRKAVNPRVVEGMRFVDYENYKTEDLSVKLENLDELFQKGQLTKVSDIKNEILKVEIQE